MYYFKKVWIKSSKTFEDHVGKIYSNPYHSIGDIVYNARDLVLIVGKKIIECPSQEKYRMFETDM